MIRANLLPRPRETSSIAGIRVRRTVLRELTAGCLVIVAVAAVGFAMETLRLRSLNATSQDFAARIAAQAPQRNEVKALALDVARYQEFVREANTFRRSGPAVAVAVARLGNAVPQRVWLESLNYESRGYRVAGGAASIEALSATLRNLDQALSGTTASLVDIDNRDSYRGGATFTARINSPAASGADGSYSSLTEPRRR